MSLNKILEDELTRAKPSQNEIEYLNNLTKEVINALESKLNKKNLETNVFIGGSLAKKTIIKKSKYDIDLFLRFDKKYSEIEIKKQMKRLFFFWIFPIFKVPGQIVKIKKIHGSRDYYQIVLKSHKDITFEIIPTVKIAKPEESRNITDLSYFHVNYLKKEINKNKKLIVEIILAKSFL